MTLIEKLKLAFTEEAPVEEVVTEEAVVEFLEVKTADGVSLKVAKLEEGEVVTVITGEGEEATEEVSVAADYILEDGTVISVNEEGLISKVEIKEEEATEEAPVEEKLEMSAILTAVKEELKGENDILMKAIDKLSLVILDQEARIEKFAKSPAATKKAVAKAEKKAVKTRLSGIEGIAAHRAAQNS